MKKNKGGLGHNKNKAKEHLLLSIDTEARTGLCKTCGTITVFKAGKKSDGTQLWRCYTAVKKTAVPRTTDMQPRQHFLTEINEGAKTAVCAKCGPVSIVPKNQNYKGKEYWRCVNKISEMRNQPHRRAKQRATNLRLNYGITPEFYQGLFETQKGRCLICFEPQKKMCVDHDHVTGKIRGLLCRKCNTGLGAFDDKILKANFGLMEGATEIAKPDADGVVRVKIVN